MRSTLVHGGTTEGKGAPILAVLRHITQRVLAVTMSLAAYGCEQEEEYRKILVALPISHEVQSRVAGSCRDICQLMVDKGSLELPT
jgi:hypothetical protein